MCITFPFETMGISSSPHLQSPTSFLAAGSVDMTPMDCQYEVRAMTWLMTITYLIVYGHFAV